MDEDLSVNTIVFFSRNSKFQESMNMIINDYHGLIA